MSERSQETRSYVIGLVLSVVLTAAAFVAVGSNGWSRSSILWLIGGLAVVQVVVQFRYFLNIDFSRQKREDLQMILFSVLMLAMLVLGTIWIMASLAMRMH